ncbi:hypothetical protein, partial [Methylobacterium thuringiense]|uniref:hypothetical protein n=1 Tax=Methylobacterium thuringiense TaxID=1003091 RepID=UPI001EDE5DBF
PDRAPSSFKLPAATGLVLLRHSGLELVRPLQEPDSENAEDARAEAESAALRAVDAAATLQAAILG